MAASRPAMNVSVYCIMSRQDSVGTKHGPKPPVARSSVRRHESVTQAPLPFGSAGTGPGRALPVALEATGNVRTVPQMNDMLLALPSAGNRSMAQWNCTLVTSGKGLGTAGTFGRCRDTWWLDWALQGHLVVGR